jgi:preprotein translocase subunit SecA
VTIATNMAGRGTDIILGEGVAQMGGLHILGTERHEARRIDNQLRGRAGRQGDPGSSQFIVSLEDNLLRLFAPQWVSAILLKLGMEEGQPIESRMVSNAIEKAQKRMEAHNFDIRKQLLEYDKVMNEQRTLIYSQRQKILTGQDVKDTVRQMLEEVVQGAIDKFLPESASQQNWDYAGLTAYLKSKFGKEFLATPANIISGKDIDEVEGILVKDVNRIYDERERVLGAEYMLAVARYVLLDKIDEKWKNHLYTMDFLRSGIGLQSYAQIDPKIAYKREGYKAFDEMLNSVKEEVADLVFKIEPMKQAEERLAALWKITSESHQEVGSFETAKSDNTKRERSPDNFGIAGDEKPQPIRAERPAGRNDPCPCGSGKKYKKCCGVR